MDDPAPPAFYGPLRLLVRDDVAVLQPRPASDGASALPPAAIDTLCIDLPTGRVSRGQLPPLAPGSAAADVPAVVGLLRLRGGSALAVVTRAERVASLDGAPVWRCAATAVITPGMRVVGAAGDAKKHGAATANGSAINGTATTNTNKNNNNNVLTASIAISRVPRAATAASSASSSPYVQTFPAAHDAGDRRLLAYLRSALDPSGAAKGLYFAHGAHLTLHTQARADLLARKAGAAAPDAASSPFVSPLSPPRCADRRFFWNRALAEPLLHAGGDAFVPTMVMGSLRVLEGAAVSPGLCADVALFARRAADRAGTRHWRRGADPDASGAVANFVETEQVVSIRRASSPSSSSPPQPILVASFVQVRGSIPLVWTQLPNIKYKPPTVVLDGSCTQQAFDAHARGLYEAYVDAQSSGAVTCVNLVNQTGSEGLLGARFAAEAERHNAEAAATAASSKAPASASCPPLRYVPFDFHHECGASGYGPGLSELWRLLAGDFEKDGMWVVGAGEEGGDGGGNNGNTTTTTTTNTTTAALSRQRGVIRTNCVDCLDRTNVVQGLLGRKALARALAMAGAALPAGEDAAASLAPDGGAGPVLPDSLESRFKHLWADHGDDVSRQYAGTGALKSGFTRTGKRTIGGLIDDGVKSAARYWLNNFGDGRKQDSLDLCTGGFVPRPDARVRFRARPSPLLPVGLALGALAWGGAALGRAFGAVFGGGGGGGGARAAAASNPAVFLLAEVGAPLALAAALLLLVVRNGRHLVDAPQLCPERANTVAAAVGKGGGVAAELAGGGKKGKGKKGKGHAKAE